MKRYCIAGASSRAYFFADTLRKRYSDCAEITAVFDINQTRCKHFATITPDIKVYGDFDAMLNAEKPDTVIVTTKDCFHHEYIVRALNKGYDVITEKPMTIDREKCLSIIEAEARTGRGVTVTFNYRFMPYITKVKQLLLSGVIGKVRAVHFEYLLGKPHGSDYMRRWHAEMKNSGGMLVHKSTHHFDLVNWLLDDEPISVTAQGSLDFYGATRSQTGKNCRSCTHKDTCEFYFDINKNALYKALYTDAEHEDGYLRDGCVFDSRIDIYDNMSASVRYKGGALLTYGMNLFNPYEGFTIVFTGDDGRIEAYQNHTGLQTQESTESVNEIKVVTGPSEETVYRFADSGGSHGGGDERMFDMIFRGVRDDKYGHGAGSFDGAKSILIGICANESIKTGKLIDIKQTLDEIRKIQSGK